MSDRPLLSVCVVTFNSGDTIGQCLDSVGQQRGLTLETVVVDNASTDDSVERAAERAFCRVIRNPRNVFFAPANNQALHASQGEFVLVLNPDTELAPDTAKTMVDALRAHPDVGAAICTIVGSPATGGAPVGPEVPHWWRRRGVAELVGSLQPWLWWRERHAALSPMSSGEDVCDVDVISDACLFARREALAGIGWYDERYRLYFTEDDLCHRLRAAGWRVCYFPFARVIHHGSTSTRKVPRLWLRWLTVKDLLVYARRHMGATAVVVLTMASALDLVLVASVRGAKWLAARIR